MREAINIQGVKIFKVGQNGSIYLTLVETDGDGAYALWREGKAFIAHELGFWGDEVFHYNYIESKNLKHIREFLHANGVGWKRSKRIAQELIEHHRTPEDLEGERW